MPAFYNTSKTHNDIKFGIKVKYITILYHTTNEYYHVHAGKSKNEGKEL